MPRFACPQCQTEYDLSQECEGKKARCGRCNLKSIVTFETTGPMAQPAMLMETSDARFVPVRDANLVDVTELLPEPITKAPTPWRFSKVIMPWLNLLIAIGLISWACFANCDSNVLALFCYPSITLVAIGSCVKFFGRISPNSMKALTIGLTVASLILWGRNDTVTYRESRIEDDGQSRIDIEEKNWRWTGAPKERMVRLWSKKDSVFDLDAWFHGPIAGTGKRHGEWAIVTWKPYSSTSKFYWYGEEVSEGEWHKLSR